MQTRITKLFGIEKPIVQAGMVWTSGWRLAAAVSHAGGLGIIGAGSMRPELLREHVQKCKQSLGERLPFAVNIPLLVPDIEKQVEIILQEKVPIVFTSAGNPKTLTPILKSNGVKVVHVVSSAKFAQKAEAAGCDAVVAEGFEAGGHNGIEETTTMVLIPGVVSAVSIPVIAAGGISSGRSMLAAMILGAEGVQIGTRFVATEEASAHQHFKDLVVAAKEGDTKLMMKAITPVRLLKNEFYQQVEQLEQQCASKQQLLELLGRGRAKLGMFSGDLKEGELEIGQVSALVNDIKPAAEVVEELIQEFHAALNSPLLRPQQQQ